MKERWGWVGLTRDRETKIMRKLSKELLQKRTLADSGRTGEDDGTLVTGNRRG